MGQSLSTDLRSRLLAAIEGGMSCRAAASRFGVAPSLAGTATDKGRICPPNPRVATRDQIASRRRERRSSPFGRRARTTRLRNCVRHCPEWACPSP